MAFFHFFKKKKPVLLRCTECYYEYVISSEELRTLLQQNRSDSLCPIKEPCHICHIGFMIPVNYTDKHGKQYLFHEIKPHITNLDPDTVMERIFNDSKDENVHFFGFFE